MAELKSHILLSRLQQGKTLTIGNQTSLALLLALPSIISELITILMEYVDTAMVGHLGAVASASIGLVSTSTWLIGGVCSALGSGFAVLVAHSVGAQNIERSRLVLRQSIVFILMFSSVVALLGICIAPYLPHWLGGNIDICPDATIYFRLYAASVPLWALNFLMSGMLRSSGNTRVPSIVNVVCCLLNVGFNYVFIYVCDLGVRGAALGTICAIGISAIVLFTYVYFVSNELKLFRSSGSFRLTSDVVGSAMHIGLPMALQQMIFTSAHIVSTLIITPLGTKAIAAHSFGITIEGLCYMPGYGIGDAATTLVGQSIGAKRSDLQQSFSRITMIMGIMLMSIMGVLMYVGVPYLMPLMTPDVEVQELTIRILRIEAFAEPLYAASIVAYSIFVGMGDTKWPSVMNLLSIWLVRLPIAVVLVSKMGLVGFWVAMCTELCFRGLIFIIRLYKVTKKNKGKEL